MRDTEDPLATQHIYRASLPWWVDEGKTECGLPADKYPTMNRVDFAAKVRAQGQQRAALTTCMTCWHTAGSHKSWEESPTSAVAREAARAQWRTEESAKFDLEMRAIAMLIETHYDEFLSLVDGLREVPQLGELAQRRKRRALRGEGA